MAASLPGAADRPWQVPATYPSGAFDVRDPAGFMQACDRSSTNYECESEYNLAAAANSGRLGVVGAIKTAVDYWAAWERALHARHATPTRCRVWAAARRFGHGDAVFGVFGCVDRMLDDAVGAARSAPNAQE